MFVFVQISEQTATMPYTN